MARYDTSPYPVLDEPPAPVSRLRNLIVLLCSLMFIGGGFFFGFVFVARVNDALGIAGQRILGVSLPVELRSPIPVPRLPAISEIVPAVFAPREAGESPGWTGKERINVLLLGVDTRPDEKGQPTRSDTIMVASLDPVHKTGALVSIPRDLWVPIPIDARRPIEDKITAAHFYGDYFRYPGGGPALAKKTVEYNLGIRIHHYAKIDFDGFEQVVDTLGGISVCVERPLVDNEYPTRDYGYMRVFIPAGLQHLDGEQALQYARSRHQDSDFGRIRRQQQVMMSIRDKALRLDVLPKLPQLLQQFSGSIETDLSPVDILALARVASQVPREDITNIALDGIAVRPFVTSGGADALMPIRSEIEKVVRQALYDPSEVDPHRGEATAEEFVGASDLPAGATADGGGNAVAASAGAPAAGAGAAAPGPASVAPAAQPAC